MFNHILKMILTSEWGRVSKVMPREVVYNILSASAQNLFLPNLTVDSRDLSKGMEP